MQCKIVFFILQIRKENAILKESRHSDYVVLVVIVIFNLLMFNTILVFFFFSFLSCQQEKLREKYQNELLTHLEKETRFINSFKSIKVLPPSYNNPISMT